MGEPTHAHDEERSGRPPIVTDELVQIVDKKICERRRFPISEISCEFPKMSPALLYDIIIFRLGYHMFCSEWVPNMLTGAHKTRDVLRPIPQRWR
jgi:hypothetical protein